MFRRSPHTTNAFSGMHNTTDLKAFVRLFALEWKARRQNVSSKSNVDFAFSFLNRNVPSFHMYIRYKYFSTNHSGPGIRQSANFIRKSISSYLCPLPKTEQWWFRTFGQWKAKSASARLVPFQSLAFMTSSHQFFTLPQEIDYLRCRRADPEPVCASAIRTPKWYPENPQLGP